MAEQHLLLKLEPGRLSLKTEGDHVGSILLPNVDNGMLRVMVMLGFNCSVTIKPAPEGTSFDTPEGTHDHIWEGHRDL